MAYDAMREVRELRDDNGLIQNGAVKKWTPSGKWLFDVCCKQPRQLVQYLQHLISHIRHSQS